MHIGFPAGSGTRSRSCDGIGDRQDQFEHRHDVGNDGDSHQDDTYHRSSMPVDHRPSKEQETNRDREERHQKQFGHFPAGAEQYIEQDARADQDGNDDQ